MTDTGLFQHCELQVFDVFLSPLSVEAAVEGSTSSRYSFEADPRVVMCLLCYSVENDPRVVICLLCHFVEEDA